MEGVPFVGNDACAHNLLLKGRPLIMRLQQPIAFYPSYLLPLLLPESARETRPAIQSPQDPPCRSCRTRACNARQLANLPHGGSNRSDRHRTKEYLRIPPSSHPCCES